MTEPQTERLPLAKAAEFVLEECRMVLPGIQALFGFQLIVVFSPGFEAKLNPQQQAVHLAAIALVVLAVVLIMAPAAYNRQSGPHHVSDGFVRVATRLLLMSMLPLALAISLDFLSDRPHHHRPACRSARHHAFRGVRDHVVRAAAHAGDAGSVRPPRVSRAPAQAACKRRHLLAPAAVARDDGCRMAILRAPFALALVISAATVIIDARQATILKAVFKDAFVMGTAVNDAIVSGRDAASQELVRRHFGSITAENVLKAGVVNPRPGVFNFAPADAFVAFGETHGLFVVGHTLVWHNQTPPWFFQDESGKPNTPQAQIERMRQHIAAVAGRYKGRIHAWDVVNEVIDNDGSYRPTTWVNAVGSGDELVKAAFRFASEYAPGAELYYNDFNAWRPAKRDGIVRMVRMLRDARIRIDGIGMQGHWGLNYPRTEYIEAAMDAFAATGVKVMITELDVDVLPLTREGQITGTVMSDPQFQLEEFKTYLDPYRDGLPEDVERQVTARWAELFRIFYSRRDKIDRVTIWGVHDGMSWKNNYPIPGRTNYPLLFRRDRTPRPALDAVLAIPGR